MQKKQNVFETKGSDLQFLFASATKDTFSGLYWCEYVSFQALSSFAWGSTGKGKVRQAHVLRCQSWSIFCMYIETALLRMCACIYAVGGFHPTTLLLTSLLPLLLSRGPSPVIELWSTGSTLVTGTQDRQRFLNA